MWNRVYPHSLLLMAQSISKIQGSGNMHRKEVLVLISYKN